MRKSRVVDATPGKHCLEFQPIQTCTPGFSFARVLHPWRKFYVSPLALPSHPPPPLRCFPRTFRTCGVQFPPSTPHSDVPGMPVAQPFYGVEPPASTPAFGVYHKQHLFVVLKSPSAPPSVARYFPRTMSSSGVQPPPPSLPSHVSH